MVGSLSAVAMEVPAYLHSVFNEPVDFGDFAQRFLERKHK